MARAALIALALAGCYSPRFAACTVECASDQSCPTGLTCASDGFCHSSPDEPLCVADAAPDFSMFIDGGIDAAIDLATPPLPDGGVVLGFGGSGEDVANAVAVAPNGELVVGGSFSGNMTVGGKTLHSNGMSDLFVARFAPDGTLRWAISAGGALDESVEALAVHPTTGDVYITGRYASSFVFGTHPMTNQGLDDAFLVKLLAADGAVRYAWPMSGPGEDVGRGIAVDANEHVAVVGGSSMRDSLTFDSSSGTAKGGLDPFFFEAVPPDLGFGCQSLDTGTAGDDFITAVAAGPQYIVVTGLSNGSGGDVRAASCTGCKTWVQQLVFDNTTNYCASLRSHTFSGGIGRGVALDPANLPAIGGSFAAPMVLDKSYTPVGEDPFVAQLQESPDLGDYNLKWTHAPSGPGADRVNALASDGATLLVAAGTIFQQVDFGGGPLSAQMGDALVVGYAPDGSWLWNLRSNAPGHEEARAVAVGANAIAVAGRFDGTLGFGSTQTSNGADDAFLLVLPR